MCFYTMTTRSLFILLDASNRSNSELETQRKKALCTRKNPLVQQIGCRLFNNRDKSGDITFRVGAKEFKAHKCVLAALSPMYYMGQLYGGFDDAKKDTIEIPNVSSAAFEEYLQFFYLDQVNLTHENIRDVLTLTEMASVDEFTNECFNFLIETLTVENVCLSYQLAVIYDRTGLIECCEHEISTHFDEVIATEGFLNCAKGDLYNILQSDSLNCKETDVFEACILWAKNSCIVDGLDAEKMENLRKTLIDGDLLYQIRFGAMTIEEFIKCCYKIYKELFTDDEREEIFYMIGKDSSAISARFSDEPRYRQWNDKQSVVCNRVVGEKPGEIFHFGLNKTIFFTDRTVLLVGFHCGKLFQSKDGEYNEKCVAFNVSIVRKYTLLDTDGKTLQNTSENVTFNTTRDAFIELQRPVMIKTNFVYEIRLTSELGFNVKNYDFLKQVEVAGKLQNVKNGCVSDNYIPETKTVIKFAEPHGLVTSLNLNLCPQQS